MLQTREKTESWKHNPSLSITSFEICTSAVLDYLKITHLPPHDTKDNCKSPIYSIPPTTFKRCYLVSMFYQNKTHRKENTEAHQSEQVCHKWKYATRLRTKLLLPIYHSWARNTLYLYCCAPVATYSKTEQQQQIDTYHQWVLPLISLTPSSFHLKCPMVSEHK